MSNILEVLELMSAKNLLDSYNIKMYPESNSVDISSLYNQLNIKIFSKNFSKLEKDTHIKNIRGFVISDDNNGITIFVSNKLSKQEQKYMAAHLLGHCCCTDFKEYNIRHIETDDNHDTVHDNAEKFAMELLMPEKSLTSIMKKLLLPSLSTLTQIYNLEPQIVQERLNDLNFIYYKDIFW